MRTIKPSNWRLDLRGREPTERQVTWIKGFDCRGGCKPGCVHEGAPKGDYGQAGDDLELAVRWPRSPTPGSTTFFEEAVSLRIFLNVRDGERLPKLHDLLLMRPALVAMHTSYMTDPDQVREPVAATKCSLLRSEQCFKNDVFSYVQSQEIWTPEDTEAFLPFVFQAHEQLDKVLRLESGVWDRLRAWGQSRIEGLRTAHLELPRRCPTCDGKGLVPRTVVDDPFK
jgi:hypothetical protein